MATMKVPNKAVLIPTGITLQEGVHRGPINFYPVSAPLHVITRRRQITLLQSPRRLA